MMSGMPDPAKKPSPVRKAWLRLVLLLLLAAPPAWFLGLIRAPKPRLGEKLSAVATIAHPLVSEASGLVQSQTNPDVFWLHNDSGDVPRIFAITSEGEVIVPEALANQGTVAAEPKPEERLYQGISIAGARLVDWEDIACHGDRLFLAEMGNNFSNRRDLGVYELAEPDPHSAEAVQATFIPIRYPDQTGFPPTGRWAFDCEAMFWWNGHLYFVTKTRPAYRVYVQGTDAALYRLDSMDPDQENVLVRIDQVENLEGWVTAADASQDGRYIALLIESPVQSVWLYERPMRGDRFFSDAASVRRLIFHDAGQLESLAFCRDPKSSREQIIILNEQRELFRLPLEAFQAVDQERR
jgi:hypothetical protein